MFFGVISYNGYFSSLSIRFTTKKVVELVDPHSFRVYMRTKLSQKGHAGNWVSLGPFPLEQFHCYFYIMGSLKGTTVNVKNFCIDDKKVQFFGDVLVCFTREYTRSDELNINSIEELSETKISLILKYLESNSANLKTCSCDILKEKKFSKEEEVDNDDEEMLSCGSVDSDYEDEEEVEVEEDAIEDLKEPNEEEEVEENEEDEENEEMDEDEDGESDEKKKKSSTSKKKAKGKKTKKQYIKLLEESNKSGEMVASMEPYVYPFEYHVPEPTLSKNIWLTSI